MAQKVVSELIDDLDGTAAQETVYFGVDGVGYEIDLSTGNAAKLRDGLAAYITVARRVGRNSSAPRAQAQASRKPVDRSMVAKVRAWASENGVELQQRGRISNKVMEAYNASLVCPDVSSSDIAGPAPVPAFSGRSW